MYLLVSFDLPEILNLNVRWQVYRTRLLELGFSMNSLVYTKGMSAMFRKDKILEIYNKKFLILEVLLICLTMR